MIKEAAYSEPHQNTFATELVCSNREKDSHVLPELPSQIFLPLEKRAGFVAQSGLLSSALADTVCSSKATMNLGIGEGSCGEETGCFPRVAVKIRSSPNRAC